MRLPTDKKPMQRLLVAIAILFSISAFSKEGTNPFLDSANQNVDCSTPMLRARARTIVSIYRTNDIEKYVNQLSDSLAQCKKVGPEVGIDMPQLQSLVTVSRRTRLEKIEKYIKLDSRFQKIDEYLDSYRSIAKSLGMTDHEIEAFVSKYQKQGEDSYSREKNSCKPVNMSAELGPVRDQKNTGLCYAYTAADLLSYKLKQRVSAADVAFNYSDDIISNIQRNFGKKESAFEGGHVDTALDETIQKGVCLEKDFPSEGSQKNYFTDDLDEIEKLRKYDSTEPLCAETQSALARVFPNFNPGDIGEVLAKSTKPDFFRQLANKSCKRIKVDFKSTYLRSSDTEKIVAAIDSNLDKNNPVGIGYNDALLFDPSVRGGPHQHASVVVGRRFNDKKGQCEYLIRNSYGEKSCPSFDASYECDRGQIWVPKAGLMESTVGVTSIK